MNEGAGSISDEHEIVPISMGRIHLRSCILTNSVILALLNIQ